MDNTIQQWESRIGRRLKLRDLHILAAVVQWGSMARAASHLAMSQPAVSESIANLEDALRVRLLDLSTRGIEPTLYAHALLRRGQVVFDELKQAISDLEFLANPTVVARRYSTAQLRSSHLRAGVLMRILTKRKSEQAKGDSKWRIAISPARSNKATRRSTRY